MDMQYRHNAYTYGEDFCAGFCSHSGYFPVRNQFQVCVNIDLYRS